MPTGSSSADTERDEADGTAGDTRDENGLRDPILLLVGCVGRVLELVNAVHRAFESLPRWTRVAFGTVSFLCSVYFGAVVRDSVDAFVGTVLAPLLFDFATVSFGAQVSIVLLLLLVLQTTIANHRLNAIDDKFQTEPMASDGTAADGGLRVERISTSKAGAIGGAAFGAVFGAGFGSPAIVGGMILGAIVGDEIEKSSVRRRKRRRLKSKIVEYLLRERVFGPETVETDTIRGWFPADDSVFVTEAVEQLSGDTDTPVVRTKDGEIQLTNAAEAVSFLDRTGGHVPRTFDGPNRPQ